MPLLPFVLLHPLLDSVWADNSYSTRSIRFTVTLPPGRLHISFDFLCHLQIYLPLNFMSPIFMRRILASTNQKVWVSHQVARGSRLLLFLNKPIRARISFFSDETNVWDTLTSRLLNVLLCYSPMNFKVWAIGVLDSARKMTFGSTVSCKWTRELRCLESLNSSFRLNWGLFRRSQTYVAFIWRRNTTDTSTLHRINNLCCAVERWRKILLEV